ncbi:uncharacterized protein EV422DRAFT_225388 [Fimicolochytrium jonesii]|uniref:uncharacterized protein n=1 Tax=Fimicolochytrium jonesii TaxID=1396493 RepID=UPI0022FE7207|nr:uncharacterized protein EV422DRAFT_225388 [Fimicolochytrium jonesii]KAI8817454.1 hypothetical protein EV422DRAFT_225388 [Fimicolochytrium jonesii]
MQRMSSSGVISPASRLKQLLFRKSHSHSRFCFSSQSANLSSRLLLFVESCSHNRTSSVLISSFRRFPVSSAVRRISASRSPDAIAYLPITLYVVPPFHVFHNAKLLSKGRSRRLFLHSTGLCLGSLARRGALVLVPLLSPQLRSSANRSWSTGCCACASVANFHQTPVSTTGMRRYMSSRTHSLRYDSEYILSVSLSLDTHPF